MKKYFFLVTLSLVCFAQNRDNHALIQQDGKRVLVGTEQIGSNLYFQIQRYSKDSTLDTSFNTTGEVLLQVKGADSEAHAVYQQADQKLLVGGSMVSNDSSGKELHFAMVRITTAGLLDTSFNTNGQVSTYADGESIRKITENSKIRAWGCEDEAGCLSVVSYNTDGSLGRH